ncbi:MAG TPA: GNAT family N-acetyltransferase [Gaiellaceae bacterium]|nr:GNAT family N-acetyltransferase [Gaiellaceae bacterium]
MELRRATQEDTDAIAALFRASFGSIGFLPTLHTPDEDRGYFHGVLAEQEVWVAEEGAELVGFAALSTEMLEHLYVRPGRQGAGVGSALLELAKERRPQGFTLWVFQRNERARLFYERHGCRLVRLTDGSANEEREPDALYGWAP